MSDTGDKAFEEFCDTEPMRALRATCEHKNTKFGTSKRYSVDFEVCLDCGKSRSVEEFGNSGWKENDIKEVNEILFNHQLAKLKAENEWLKNDILQVIQERDESEDKIQQIDVALGGSGEWSNLRDCGDEALAAIELLKIQSGIQWIPVTPETMPKEDGDVFVTDGNDIWKCGYFDSIGRFQIDHSQVTHWANINLPKGE